MSCAKTAELIEMLFGMWTQMGPRNRVLVEGPDPQGKEQFFLGGGRFLQSGLSSKFCDTCSLLLGKVTISRKD